MKIPERFFELGFDQEQFDLRFAKLPRVYPDCLRLYFKSNEIELLDRYFKEKNWKEAENCSHNLKGASGNLALMSLFHIYEKTTKILGGSDPESAAELVKQAVELEKQFREAADPILQKCRKK